MTEKITMHEQFKMTSEIEKRTSQADICMKIKLNNLMFRIYGRIAKKLINKLAKSLIKRTKGSRLHTLRKTNYCIND